MQRLLRYLVLFLAASLIPAAAMSPAPHRAGAAPLAGPVLAANLTLALTSSGPGAATGGGSYPAGSVAILNATPNAGAIFTGWFIDGRFDGWADQRDVTMSAAHTVVATFAARPSFPDVPVSNPAYDVIGQLAARGIIRGYQNGNFGPGDPTKRAQMAALIARTFPSNAQSGPGIGPQTWDLESHGNPFPDQGFVDANLWRNAGTLNFYNVARGFQDGTYRPIDNVLYVQVISFITRAMVTNGYWQEVTVDDPSLYPNIPLASGHRFDVLTYFQYADAIPGTNPDADWVGWDTPATRAWFALALWQALDNFF
jgi:hypothetical protein